MLVSSHPGVSLGADCKVGRGLWSLGKGHEARAPLGSGQWGWQGQCAVSQWADLSAALIPCMPEATLTLMQVRNLDSCCVPRISPDFLSNRASYRPKTPTGSTGRVPGATAAPTAEKGDKAPLPGPGAGAEL